MLYEQPVVHSWGTVRVFLDLLSRESPISPMQLVSEDWRVQKIRELIDNDPGNGRSNLDQICSQLELCMSSRQARRLFKSYTGIGIKQYAKQRCLEVEAQKLRTTDAPIKAIAAEAGYRHVGNFTRSFLKQFRMCPVEFRRIWRDLSRCSMTVNVPAQHLDRFA